MSLCQGCKNIFMFMQPSISSYRVVGKKKSRAREDGVAMEKDIPVGLERILTNCLAPQEGEAVLRQHCLQWEWEGADLDWGHYWAVEVVLRGSPQSCHNAFPGRNRGWGLSRVPQISCRAVMVDTPPQHCVAVGDSAPGQADWGGGPPS
ncbi:hypothetical protein CHARACLAT_007882 [Characodon lateralis]|uniref:Uncharacterized protein n=1 Tax=Characodon lateralis TaxID=208331 RepID=A0ABU7F143_9TELE|nr:hypothetical protein [Characodon lateralis]